jgi:hypothetical protein
MALIGFHFLSQWKVYRPHSFRHLCCFPSFNPKISLFLSAAFRKFFDMSPYIFALGERLFHAHFNKYWNMKLTRNSFFSDIRPVVRWVSIYKFVSEIMALKWKGFVRSTILLFLMNCVFFFPDIILWSFMPKEGETVKQYFIMWNWSQTWVDSGVTSLRRNHVEQS